MPNQLDPILIDYSTLESPTLTAFHHSDAFLRGLMGPFGSGKSSSAVWEIILKSLNQRPGRDGVRRTRWAVTRKTYPQLKDTTQKTFFDWFPHEQFGRFNKTDHDYVIDRIPMKDGTKLHIEIMFRALELEKHVENLLSLELTGAWINEARDFPLPIVNGLMGRVGRFPSMRNGGPTWWGVMADTNPPDEDSWWYRLFEETDFSVIPAALLEKMGNREAFAQIFRQPSGLSPNAENLHNLAPGYYETLAALNPPDWVKVYVLGEYGFVQEGRPVYPEYNDRFHLNETLQPIPGLPIYRGWDFGLSPAVVFVQVDAMGALNILDEAVATNISLEQFADEVKAQSGRNFPGFQFKDIGDPAGSSRSSLDPKLRTAFQILSVKNIECFGGIQDIKIRLESVRAALNRLRSGNPGLQVHPRAKMIRKGFLGRYQYRKMTTREDQYQKEPDKNAYSHPHDALQYVAAELLGGTITTKPLDFKFPRTYNTDIYL